MKVQVLHIIKGLGRGGAEMLLPETLKLHSKSEFGFHYIYFLPWKDQLVTSIREAGGKVTCFQAKNNILILFQARRIARYVRDNQIQLIHAHLPWSGVVARIAGKLTKVPVIYTEHNKQERYHFATRFLNLRTMNWLTYLVAVSDDVKNSIRKFKPGLTIPVETILNGVNTIIFSRKASDGSWVRQSLGIPADAPIIGTIAVFRFQKRLMEWLAVAGIIKEKFPSIHFVIVGDGPLKDELFQKRKELKLEGCVHFVGLQAEVRPFLAAFDIYMMSSVFEGLPIALLEAMSMGLPVVSTNAGGIREVVRNEKEGLLTEVDDWFNLTEYALLLLHDRERRNALGLAARQRIEEAFSMDRMVRTLEHTYRNLVHHRRHAVTL